VPYRTIDASGSGARQDEVIVSEQVGECVVRELAVHDNGDPHVHQVELLKKHITQRDLEAPPWRVGGNHDRDAWSPTTGLQRVRIPPGGTLTLRRNERTACLRSSHSRASEPTRGAHVTPTCAEPSRVSPS